MQEDNLDFSLLVYGGLMKQVYTSTHQLQKWQGLDVLIVYTKKKNWPKDLWRPWCKLNVKTLGTSLTLDMISFINIFDTKISNKDS